MRTQDIQRRRYDNRPGDSQGGGSPLVGGAGSIDGCQRFWLVHSVLPAWGEPARPGFPRRGNGKGEFKSLLPQADLLQLEAATDQ